MACEIVFLPLSVFQENLVRYLLNYHIRKFWCHNFLQRTSAEVLSYRFDKARKKFNTHLFRTISSPAVK